MTISPGVGAKIGGGNAADAPAPGTLRQDLSNAVMAWLMHHGRMSDERARFLLKSWVQEYSKGAAFEVIQAADECLRKGDLRDLVSYIKVTLAAITHQRAATDVSASQGSQVRRHGNQPAITARSGWGRSIARSSLTAPPGSTRQEITKGGTN